MRIPGILRIFKKFLFSRANKEFVVFIFFLALSGIFWLFTTLNEVYEYEFEIPVSVVGVPKNAVLTSEETDTVRMTIRDKGITLLTYMYGDILKKINVSFKTYSKSNGTGVVTASELQKLVYQQLANGSRITGVKPDKLEFYYNYGAKKKVPVRWSGRVIPEEMFFISRVAYQPDSITIYASHEKLDSINVVYTEQLNYVNFRDTLIADCELNKIKGVKMIPDRTKVTFFTDVLTEEEIEDVPIRAVNMPVGKHLRTFPAKINISFVAGVSVYRSLKPTDFVVIADYNEIINHPTEKCHIYLKSVPRGISRARLEVSMVDYLIEDHGRLSDRRHRMKIGLTGGIGSGKSYVCKYLEQHGIEVFDCDTAAKVLMRYAPDIRRKLTELIGPDAYNADGSLNKAVVAQFLLSSPANAT